GVRARPAVRLRARRAAGRGRAQHQGGAVSGGTVTIIDYGAGNLASLNAAFRRLGRPVQVTADPERVAAARRLVLPGVGAAAPALRELRRLGADAAIGRALRAGGSLFGICLGMQLLFERSDEGGADC